MKPHVVLIDDSRLAALALEVAHLAESDDAESGWDARWTSELLASDLRTPGIATPLTLRAIAILSLQARREYYRGRRAKREGLTLEECPYPQLMAELDHQVQFAYVSWREGWKSLQQTEDFAVIEVKRSARQKPPRFLEVSTSAEFDSSVAGLESQFVGVSTYIDRALGCIAKASAGRNLKSDKSREEFVELCPGYPQLKIHYRIMEGKIHVDSITTINLQTRIDF